MKQGNLKIILQLGIALVWLINGLFCKLLNMVPRHQEIVGRILGDDHALQITKAIGVGELFIVVWIVSRIKSKWCSIVQIALVITMNMIEAILAPDLLLFGRANLFVALVFVILVYMNEFFPVRINTTSDNAVS
ncbi:DoxX-like family protein [Sporocytophaga myxococcoides]|nr:DoxX-like family protein [Sporocytophaga myxococcoides]